MNRTSVESTCMMRIPSRLVPATLMHARYVTHNFHRHTHDEYGFGTIERGAMKFHYRGDTLVAGEGEVNTVDPGEVHDGERAVPDGWNYRMIYLDPKGLHELRRRADELHRIRDPRLPTITDGVIIDPPLSRLVHLLHRAAKTPNNLLATESLLVAAVMRLFSHTTERPAAAPSRNAGLGFRTRLIRDYLTEHAGDNVSLIELSTLTDLSPFHLLRAFRADTGLTPHECLRDIRINRAKFLLGRGASIADVAAVTGFADQSHLTRTFRRIVGVTPGIYRNIVQD